MRCEQCGGPAHYMMAKTLCRNCYEMKASRSLRNTGRHAAAAGYGRSKYERGLFSPQQAAALPDENEDIDEDPVMFERWQYHGGTVRDDI